MSDYVAIQTKMHGKYNFYVQSVSRDAISLTSNLDDAFLGDIDLVSSVANKANNLNVAGNFCVIKV